MSQVFRKKIAYFDELIRKGEAARVRSELRAIERGEVPREVLADFANTARRAGLPSLGLRLLQPVFKSELDLGKVMQPRERASYAASLAAIGAHEEAYTLLRAVENDPTPDVQLYLGFISMYRWDYSSAIKHLEKYLGLSGLSEYQVFVAKVNLAGSLSFENETEKLLSLTGELIEIGKANGWNLARSSEVS
jgi:hypothetical protein